MKFFRKNKNSGREAEILDALLDGFKAASLPASQMDWRDLQRRMALAPQMRTPPVRANRTKEKTALAFCAAILLLAARPSPFPFLRRPLPQAPQFALIPSSLAPQSSSPVSQSSSLMRRGTRIAPQATYFTARGTKIIRPATKTMRRATKTRTPSRKAARRNAWPRTRAQSPQRLAQTPEAPNPETTRIALNVDGENMAFFVLLTNYVLPTVQTAAPKEAPRTYVTAAIPAAPTPGTTENQMKELQPW